MVLKDMFAQPLNVLLNGNIDRKEKRTGRYGRCYVRNFILLFLLRENRMRKWNGKVCNIRGARDAK